MLDFFIQNEYITASRAMMLKSMMLNFNLRRPYFMSKFFENLVSGSGKKDRIPEELVYMKELNEKVMYWKSSLGSINIF